MAAADLALSQVASAAANAESGSRADVGAASATMLELSENSVQHGQAVSQALQQIARGDVNLSTVSGWAAGQGGTDAQQQAAQVAVVALAQGPARSTGSNLVSGDGQAVTAGDGSAVALGSAVGPLQELADKTTAVTQAHTNELAAVRNFQQVERGMQALESYDMYVPADTRGSSEGGRAVAAELRGQALNDTKAPGAALLMMAAGAAERGDHAGVAAVKQEFQKEFEKAQDGVVSALTVTREAQAALPPSIQGLYTDSPAEAFAADRESARGVGHLVELDAGKPAGEAAGDANASVRTNYAAVAVLAGEMLSSDNMTTRVQAMESLRGAASTLAHESDAPVLSAEQTDRAKLAEAIDKVQIPDTSALQEALNITQGLDPQAFAQLASSVDADTRVSYAQGVLERADTLQTQYAGDTAQAGVNALYALSQALVEGDPASVESAAADAQKAVTAMAETATRETFDRLVPELAQLDAHKDVLDARAVDTPEGDRHLSVTRHERDDEGNHNTHSDGSSTKGAQEQLVAAHSSAHRYSALDEQAEAAADAEMELDAD
jgi:hypothetical protein